MNFFGKRTHVAEEAPPAVNGHAPAPSAAAALTWAPPPFRAYQEPLAPAPPADDDGIIRRFEALLVHGPKNIKIHKTLAEAYARKMMFDKSLSFYQSALKIAGGKNAAIEKAIEETTLKKIDRELSQLDPKAPDYAAQRERIENQRLNCRWQAMEGELTTANEGTPETIT